MQTPEGAKKMRQNMITKYGSEENWRAEMRTRGSQGGKAPHEKRGLAAADPALVREVSIKGVLARQNRRVE
jgi:hypothetical protein